LPPVEIKLSHPIALAALVAVALIVPASTWAAPPALCSVAARTGSAGACSVKDLIKHVHEKTVGDATLLTGLYDIDCAALFLGDVKAADSLEASPTVVGAFTYSQCTGGCIYSEENGPLEVDVSKAGHETEDVIAYYLSHLECQGFVNCTYKKGPIPEKRRDPASSAQPNGEVSLHDESMFKESGALCLDTGSLDIVTTPLEPVYVTG
jgi:hypothetical protein